MRWLLGLDAGTNSLGWAAFEIHGDEKDDNSHLRLIDLGVRLFSDGREPSSPGRVGESLSVERRTERGMSRNRDRGKNRKKALLVKLQALSLLPKAQEELDQLFRQNDASDPLARNPYRLRAEAAEGPVSAYHLGRALYHLGLRRGYLSNRKETTEDDGGSLKAKMDAMTDQLAGRTLGQFLWDTYQSSIAKDNPDPIRFKEGSTLYPARHHYRVEFEAIRKTQENHHSLSQDDWDTLRDKHILFQHPLRPVERGSCDFYPEEPRHWQATPVAHRFRILQDLNNLRVVAPDLSSAPLTTEQYAAIKAQLLKTQTVKFTALRNLKDGNKARLFDRLSSFNLESEKRKDLKGDYFSAKMRKDAVLDPVYGRHYASGTLDDIVEVLHSADTDDEARDTLSSQFDLDAAEIDALIALPLPSGTTNLSRKIMDSLIPIMEDQGLGYAHAVDELTRITGQDFHHSKREGAIYNELPYYGQALTGVTLGRNADIDPAQDVEGHYGRINNPTVHTALNTLRQLVNTLVRRFGAAPETIHVEMVRALKLPKKLREDMERQHAKNQRINDQIRDFCRENGVMDPHPRDIKKVKLWQELGKNQLERLCPYSGTPISAAMLFNGDVEIEHIIPYSQTLDDSLSNMTLATKAANALKGNQTPYAAFGSDFHADKGFVWSEIAERIQVLPRNKHWRFGRDAHAQFEDGNGFIARQLTDTAYMSRIGARYLRTLSGVKDVVPNRGKLTGMLRGRWGLNGLLSDDNQKSRDDHRHHAVDAFVTALVSRSVLAAISRDSGKTSVGDMHIDIPQLDAGLVESLSARIKTVIPSVKQDHGLSGRMYKETAYGFTKDKGYKNPLGNLVTRKPITGLSLREIGQIIDPDLRRAVEDAVSLSRSAGEKYEDGLARFGRNHGVKRVRIFVLDQTVKPIASAPYKGYTADSFVCCDIWRIPPKKKGGKPRFTGRYWRYDEMRGSAPDADLKRPHPAAKFCMRLFKKDTVAIGPTDAPTLLRIYGFSTTNNKLDLRPLEKAAPDRSYVSINQLGQDSLRRLTITVDGRILKDRGGYL